MFIQNESAVETEKGRERTVLATMIPHSCMYGSASLWWWSGSAGFQSVAENREKEREKQKL